MVKRRQHQSDQNDRDDRSDRYDRNDRNDRHDRPRYHNNDSYQADDRSGKRQRRGSVGSTASQHDKRGCTVFVGNLSFQTTWQGLKDHMRKSGNVDSANILKKANGQSKGCALVDYQNVREVQRALRELHNSQLDGRSIVVQMDESHGGVNDNDNRRDTNTARSFPATIYVGNIPWDSNEPSLRNVFSRFGKILSVSLPQKPNGKSKGFALVEFKYSQDATDAIQQMNQYEFQDRRLDVSLSRDVNSQRPDHVDERGSGGHSNDDGIILFVGNLPSDTRWQDLKDHIRVTCGPISDDIQVHEGTKRSYATVKVKSGINLENAKNCVERLHKTQFQDFILEVRFDRKNPNKPVDSNQKAASSAIFVKNLSYDTKWEGLKDHARNVCGSTVRDVQIKESNNGRSKGVAIVEFDSPNAASRALGQLEGTELDGRTLEVRADRFAGSVTRTSSTNHSDNNNNKNNAPDKRGGDDRKKSSKARKPKDAMDDKPYDFESALNGALSSSR